MLKLSSKNKNLLQPASNTQIPLDGTKRENHYKQIGSIMLN